MEANTCYPADTLPRGGRAVVPSWKRSAFLVPAIKRFTGHTASSLRQNRRTERARDYADPRQNVFQPPRIPKKNSPTNYVSKQTVKMPNAPQRAILRKKG
jgi:hypothetical protein